MIQFQPETTDEDKVKLLQDLTRRLFKEWARACDDRDQAVQRAATAKADWKMCDQQRNAHLGKIFELDAQIADLRRQIEELQKPGLLSQLHMQKSVDELDLSVRAANCLQALGIETVGQLVKTSFHRLLSQKHLNKKVLEEIRTELGKLGLKLRGDK